jgi:hypothetical protein
MPHVQMAEPVRVFRNEPVTLALASRTSFAIRLPAGEQENGVGVGSREFHSAANVLHVGCTITLLEVFQVPRIVRSEIVKPVRDCMARDQNEMPARHFPLRAHP